ncbi:MAG: type IV pilin protein [Sarcina sp.]
MIKNIKTKKKGFTLIELVIVLAVLAIIALIAIPNFTKVRNDSLKKADKRTAEQIEKITLMAIANEKLDISNNNYAISFPANSNPTVAPNLDGTPSAGYFAGMLTEVKKPQYKPDINKGFTVIIDSSDGSVTNVVYTTAGGTAPITE